MSASADIDSEDEDLPLEALLEALTRDLSQHTQRPTSSLSCGCCCGSDECESLRQSRRMVQELESQMKIAGSLGQALLKRHENSMAEAESREQSTAITISELEMKTAQLELENEKTAASNKRLLNTLEELNTNMALSEGRVNELQEDLDAAHAELSLVSAHAARTAVLEAQLAVLESEQEELRNIITTTKEDERAAIIRWRRSERQLAELEQQLERIDRERALEKARTQNILERMEQRKCTNQRLGTFPAALADKSALSRFMKEILAENGHLQLGVAELRDMLAQSQDEVNILREKLESMDNDRFDKDQLPLNMELARSPLQNGGSGGGSLIVHHHHYHVPPPPPPPGGREKIAPKLQIRRPKKKRNVVVDHFDSLRYKGYEHAASPALNSFPKRWSSSTGTGHLSSSPTSTFQEPSIFDRLDNSTETSRPTSSDSNFPPPWPKQSWAKHNHMPSNPPPFTILHTTEEVASESDNAPSPPRASSPLPVPQIILKRSTSHESLLSTSAMDRTAAYPISTPSASSSHASRRTPHIGSSAKANDPQSGITRGIAIRHTPGTQWEGSAYSRLLGLHQAEGASPPSNSSSKTASRKPSASSSSTGSGWFWKYVTLAPGGSKPGRSEEPLPPQLSSSSSVGGGVKRGTTNLVSGYVDQGLLKESLVDGPGSSRR